MAGEKGGKCPWSMVGTSMNLKNRRDRRERRGKRYDPFILTLYFLLDVWQKLQIHNRIVGGVLCLCVSVCVSAFQRVHLKHTSIPICQAVWRTKKILCPFGGERGAQQQINSRIVVVGDDQQSKKTDE